MSLLTGGCYAQLLVQELTASHEGSEIQENDGERFGILTYEHERG